MPSGLLVIILLQIQYLVGTRWFLCLIKTDATHDTDVSSLYTVCCFSEMFPSLSHEQSLFHFSKMYM